MRIFKYTLPDHGLAIISTRQGATILSVADQCGALQMWAMVGSTKPPATRHFQIVHTGFDEVDDDMRFIGTALSQGGNIVRHVFEVWA